MRTMLLLAGDVERNPGPAEGVHGGSTERWLGISDVAAAELLALLREAAAAAAQEDGWGDAGTHAWDHPAVQALADCIEARLEPVAPAQGLTAAAVANLERSEAFERHRHSYYPDSRPFNHSLGWAVVKDIVGDGNCLFRSALVATSGSEAEGRTALRLRCLLHLIANIEIYRRSAAVLAAREDFGARLFADMATPGGFLPMSACAILASVLQCPVLLCQPGFPTFESRELECGYFPPLFRRAATTNCAIPVVLTWPAPTGPRLQWLPSTATTLSPCSSATPRITACCASPPTPCARRPSTKNATQRWHGRIAPTGLQP